MNGYLIVFTNSHGEKERTWMGDMQSSFSLKGVSKSDLVAMFFKQAHPGCSIVSMKSCSYAEYMSMDN